MKVLRLTCSADLRPTPPPEQRTPALLKSMLEAATGEEVHIRYERAWPAPRFPATIARLLDAERPDLVTIWINPFWYAYYSAPSRLERFAGSPGRVVADVARAAAKQPWLAYNRPFRAARRLALGTVGGAYLYEPEQLAQAVGAWLRTINQHEDVLALVYNASLPWFFEPSEASRERNEARRRQLNALLRPICHALRAHCDTRDPQDSEPIEGDGSGYVESDRLHPNARGHAWLARDQLPALLAAWKALRATPAGVSAR